MLEKSVGDSLFWARPISAPALAVLWLADSPVALCRPLSMAAVLLPDEPMPIGRPEQAVRATVAEQVAKMK
jgi:hypothetical protein